MQKSWHKDLPLMSYDHLSWINRIIKGFFEVQNIYTMEVIHTYIQLSKNFHFIAQHISLPHSLSLSLNLSRSISISFLVYFSTYLSISISISFTHSCLLTLTLFSPFHSLSPSLYLSIHLPIYLCSFEALPISIYLLSHYSLILPKLSKFVKRGK